MISRPEYMNPTNIKEVFQDKKVEDEIIYSSLGRIYSTEKYPMFKMAEKEYSVISSKPYKINLGLNNKAKEELEEFYGEIEYCYTKVSDLNMIELSYYIHISDLFMKHLIKKKKSIPFYMDIECGGFEEYVEDFIKTNKDCFINTSDACRLLKPVFYRFLHLKENTKAIENLYKTLSLRREKLPPQITLYDIEAKVENSKLKILENLEIDLSEFISVDLNGKHKLLEMKCISLGRIKKFDSVIIYSKENRVTKIILTGKGFYIRKKEKGFYDFT